MADLQKLLAEVMRTTNILSGTWDIFESGETLSTRNILSITWNIFKDSASFNITDYFDYYSNIIRGRFESLSIVDYLSKGTSSYIFQYLDLSSFLDYTFQFNRFLLETLALADYYDYLLGISAYLTQTISIIDYVLAVPSGLYYESFYEIIALSATLFKTASLYRTISMALSDYWDRQVNFTRVYTYDITFSGFLISVWTTSVEFVQGLLLSDPYIRVIILTVLQMSESMNILDFMAQMVPNVYKYITLYLKDTTIDIYTKKITTTVYTQATAVALYLKRISQILYGKLRTSRR